MCLGDGEEGGGGREKEKINEHKRTKNLTNFTNFTND